MFKKTLLALAITGFAGSAVAATVTSATEKVSAEGVVNETSFTPGTDLEVTAGLAGGYVVGDTIVFTFPNDVLAITTNATLTDGGVGAPDITVGAPVYSNGNTISFQITAITTPIIKDSTLTLGGVVFEGANIAAGNDIDVDFSVTSSVNGSSYEKVSGTIAETKDQFAATIATADKFNGIINVDKDRKEFTVADPSVQDDTLTVTWTNDTAGVTTDAVVSKLNFTLNGDFSFLDTDGDGSADYSITVTNATDEALASDLQSLTWSTTTVTTSTFDVEVEASVAGADATVIPTQAYSVDAVATYQPKTAGTSAKTETYALDAGEWTLNGSEDEIAFLPFGSDYAQSITVTNNGSKPGEITVELTAGGTTYTKVLAAQAEAKSVTNISLEVAAFAAESGITSNAAIKVIVNATDTNDEIQVKGLYYHKPTADRVLTY